MTILRIVLVLLALALPEHGAAQIRGVVVEASTGRPLSGVSITTRADTTWSDSIGRFSIAVTPNAPAAVRFAFVGFSTLDTIFAPGSPGVTVALVRTFDVDTLAVSGPTRELDLAGELDAEMVERIPTPFDNDPIRALEALPAVASLNEMSAEFSVRGGGPDQVAVLLDGFRVFSPYHALGTVGGFPALAVGRMSLVPASLSRRLTGAASGELAVSSALAADTSYRGAASIGLLAATASLRDGDPGALSWAATARRSHLDLFSRLLGRTQASGLAFADAHAHVSHTFGGARRTQTLWSTLYASSDDIAGRFFESDDFASTWSNVAGGAGWRLSGARSDMTVRAGGAAYDADVGIGETQRARTRQSVGTLYVDVESEYARGPLELRGGARLEHMTAHLRGSTGSVVGDSMRSETGVLGGWLEAAATRGGLRPSIGLRLARVSDDVAIDPSLRVRYERGSLEVGAHVSRSSQWLSGLRDEHAVLPGAALFLPHDDAMPLTVRDEVGLGVAFELIGLRVRADAYTAKLSDVATWFPDPERSIDALTFDDGSAHGVEVAAAYRHGIYRIQAGYVWSEVTLERTNAPAFHPSWDLRHQLDVIGSISPGRWTFSARASYHSGRAVFPITGYVPFVRFQPGQGTGGIAGFAALYSDRQLRAPEFFRLDIGTRYSTRIAGLSTDIYAGILNATGRFNVLYYKSGATGLLQGVASDPLLVPVVTSPLAFLPQLGIDVRF